MTIVWGVFSAFPKKMEDRMVGFSSMSTLPLAFTLTAALALGCSGSDENGGGGSGAGGSGGTGGMPECLSPEDCDDDGNECTAALCTDGMCETAPVEDGTACTEGDECRQGSCVLVFPCTEQGIRDAIAEGGGPHFFACDGPTTVVTETEIIIDNDVILDGEGELTVDGDEDHRVFSAEDGVETELRRVTVTGGFTDGDSPDNGGGGIFNHLGGTLTLTSSTVSGNTTTGSGAAGGGIFNDLGGTLTLTSSTVSGNTATGAAGGIENHGTLTLTNSTVSENDAAVGGGGIENQGTLTVTNSTVSGNTADGGGGIFNFVGGTLMLTNSTVSGNTATGVGGGGIFNTGRLRVTNSTVSGNTADGGGGIVTISGTLTLTNTLMDGDCLFLGGGITSAGGNLESPLDTCGFGNPVDDLKLGDLQDNGGPTFTHALMAGSPAIDVIEQAMCGVDKDQRGEPRPETGGTMCDVGAFEVQP